MFSPADDRQAFLADPLLTELPVLVVDCQATGATPALGSLLEVGWIDLAADAAQSRLVALPDGASISPWVRKLTGISEAISAEGEAPQAVWRALANDAISVARRAGRDHAIAVAHYASFEQRFLWDLHRTHGEGAFPIELLCTHRLAQRLFPDLPRRSLRALCGYVGAPLSLLRRSADHASATAALWRALIPILDQRGVRTLGELRALLDQRAPKKGKRIFPMAKEERAELPDAPGVYRFLRLDGSLLYVGKATSLKKRVASYFQGGKKAVPERTLEMLTQARRLDVTPTPTAIEAALLEHDEIKHREPPYNVVLRGGSLCFASTDLRDFTDRYDASHPIGPVRDGWVLSGIDVLAAAVAGGDAEPHVVVGRDVAGAPESALFAAGLATFRARHREVEPSVRELLRLGGRLAAREHTEDGDEWTVENVADALEERLARAAHAIRRSRWIALLSESSVWFEGRVLVICGGEIVQRAIADRPPWPPGAWRSARERRERLDLDRVDRLRVLTTELRTLVKAGGRAAVRLGAGAPVEGSSLARLLRLV